MWLVFAHFCWSTNTTHVMVRLRVFNSKPRLLQCLSEPMMRPRPPNWGEIFCSWVFSSPRCWYIGGSGNSSFLTIIYILAILCEYKDYIWCSVFWTTLFTDAAHAEEVHLRSQYPVCFSENNQRLEKQHLSIIAPSAWRNRKFVQIEVLLDYFAWTFWTQRTTFETSWPQIVISCSILLLYPADFDELLVLG